MFPSDHEMVWECMHLSHDHYFCVGGNDIPFFWFLNFNSFVFVFLIFFVWSFGGT